jgi:uncharacterized protein YcbK (DUF882 family)
MAADNENYRDAVALGILERAMPSRWFTLLLAGVVFIGSAPKARTDARPSEERRLQLYHTHTGEHIDVVYRRGAVYVPAALTQLDHFLRDHRTGEVHHFDPGLFDLLADLTQAVGSTREIHVICGYRTPWSNEFLRTRSAHTGVALHSLHMQAEAIDIRLPGIPTSAVRDAALLLHRGGVGYYRGSDFVHVDTGRVRRW